MKIVADASAIATWVFKDEQSKTSDLLKSMLANDEEVIISELTSFEIGNTMIVAERRGRIDEKTIAAFSRELENFQFNIVNPQSFLDVINLAKKHRLSFYDASYLQLAKQENAILATNDRQLNDAAKNEKIGILEEL